MPDSTLHLSRNPGRERRTLITYAKNTVASRLQRRVGLKVKKHQIPRVVKDEPTIDNNITPILFNTPKGSEVIDLVVSTKQCAICSNVLGQSDNITSLIYVYENCGCVICGECLSACGSEDCKPLLSAVPAWCPKQDHFKYKLQEAQKIFSLDCLICFEEEGYKRVKLICGHTYCRNCIQEWFQCTAHGTCPYCRTPGYSSKNLIRFYPLQRGVLCK